MKPKQLIPALAIITSVAVLAAWSLFGSPEINVTCNINRSGFGTCSFTNSGDASGGKCGKVSVGQEFLPDVWKDSNIICSGEIEPFTTKSVNVQVPGFRSSCGGSGGSCQYVWKD